MSSRWSAGRPVEAVAQGAIRAGVTPVDDSLAAPHTHGDLLRSRNLRRRSVGENQNADNRHAAGRMHGPAETAT